MTEKEKMLRGEYYHSRDEELLETYHRARVLLSRYNQISSRDTESRTALLQDLLGGVGVHLWIEAPFFCDYGENIYLGDNTFLNMNCVLLDSNRISIGKNALLGPHVQIYTVSHPLKATERIIPSQEDGQTTYLSSSQPVNIGDQVWIGGNTIILPGVTIGNNVTIGAGSVVTKDLPDNVLALGNPCRVIRSL